MNRDFMLLTNLIETNKKELEKMPAWKRLEQYYNCDIPVKKEFRKSLADTLRSIANKIDPIPLKTRQLQM